MSKFLTDLNKDLDAHMQELGALLKQRDNIDMRIFEVNRAIRNTNLAIREMKKENSNV